MMIDEFVGVLLAGGKSSRFGTNKALTIHANKKLIEYPAVILSELFRNRLLITNTPEDYTFLGWQITGDIYPDAGPLAGIHAALKSADFPYIFVAGCDMPFLNKKLITFLCTLIDGYDVVIPRTTNGLEPLHGVYRRDIITVIERNLARGKRKISKVFSELKVREVNELELLTVVSDLSSFRNINTPEDMPK